MQNRNFMREQKFGKFLVFWLSDGKEKGNFSSPFQKLEVVSSWKVIASPSFIIKLQTKCEMMQLFYFLESLS